MIAVETNLLVYAHRSDVAEHERARAMLGELVDARRTWAVPWPCVHEFLTVVTDARFQKSPTPVPMALAAITALTQAGGAVFLGETVGHLGILARLLERSGVTGARVHDAKIAAICLGHDVDELWTADRDFGYFPELRTRNPLVAGATKYKQA